MKFTRRTMAAILASGTMAAALISSGPASAMEFPTKPVRLVIPFGPGGSNDTFGRILADRLGKLWGQTVVVENRPGAGSTIGSAHVSQAKPDGHTLLFVSSSYVTAAATQTKLPYDPVKDLAPVGYFGLTDLYMIVSKDLPVKNLADYKQEAEKRTVFGGAPGVGSISHFVQLMLIDTLGIKSEIVQHNSGGAVMTDIGGGRVDSYFGVVFEAANDAARPLVVMSNERSAAYPDVPTIIEEGYPDAVADLWYGVFAPGGTPEEVVTKINHDLAQAMKDAAEDPFIVTQGIKISDAPPVEFASRVKADIERWSAVAVKNGIRQ